MTKAKTPKQAPAKGIQFAIKDGFRPSAGTRLASHTAAVLGLSGLIDGAKMPASELRQLIGDTAFGYHSRKGNLTRAADGVSVSEQGQLLFMARAGVDPEMIAAYEAVLTTGKPDGNLVKVPEAIAPLKAAAKAAK